MDIIRFDYMSLIFNPFVLMFITIASGLLFGKIKFGRFSLGASGALFSGLAIGFSVYKLAAKIYSAGDDTVSGFSTARTIFESNGGKLINSAFFQTSLIFFVAAVGLLAAKDLGIVLKKYGVKFVILGLVITLVGAGATYAATGIVKNTSSYGVAGVYTGALTSSPGLASSIETSEKLAKERAGDYSNLSDKEKESVIEIINLTDGYNLKVSDVDKLDKTLTDLYVSNATSQVGMGYAVGYPFGVIIVILAVNLLSVIFRIDVEEEKRKYSEEMSLAKKNVRVKDIPVQSFNMISFAIVCFAGYMLGNLNINLGPLGYICLESTGGVLIASLVLGYIGKIGPISFKMNPDTLSVIRDIGLVFFLSIVGLNYGYGAVTALAGSGITLAVVSLIVGTLAILAGFLLGRYIFKINWVMLCGAICGGMTSTPGLGAATDAMGSDDPGAGYGATYPFALFGMIIFTIIMFKLPMI